MDTFLSHYLPMFLFSQAGRTVVSLMRARAWNRKGSNVSSFIWLSSDRRCCPTQGGDCYTPSQQLPGLKKTNILKPNYQSDLWLLPTLQRNVFSNVQNLKSFGFLLSRLHSAVLDGCYLGRAPVLFCFVYPCRKRHHLPPDTLTHSLDLQ